MVDWASVGGTVAAVLGGAYGWWQRRKRKRTERPERPEPEPEPEPWDGEERRKPRAPLTGKKLVLLIEEDTAPLPRHWLAEVAGVAAHKVNGAMSAPLLRIEAVEQGLLDLRKELKAAGDGIRAEMREEGKDTRNSVEKLGTLVQRLIGRAFPNMPLE